MSHLEDDTIYISLKGAWPAKLAAEASEAIKDFFDLRGYGGDSDPHLDEIGQAFARDTTIHTTRGLDELCAVLEKGPAWIITLVEGDDTSIENIVYGPGVETRNTFLGNLDGDPSVPFSRTSDTAYLAQVKAAMQISKMTFEASADGP